MKNEKRKTEKKKKKGRTECHLTASQEHYCGFIYL